MEGQLNEPASTHDLVRGVDAVVHAALDRPGAGFRGAEGDLLAFAQTNIMGSLRLMWAARAAKVARFVFISTCAVHEVILEDRPLDEAHPLWPTSHYGAHKAAIEKFVHSFGLGDQWPICALRPTGIYGVARPIEMSRWFKLVQQVAAGERIESDRGGKEVHAADVAKAVDLLLRADAARVAGQAYNCYDRYIAESRVAEIAREISGSGSAMTPSNRGPKHQIETGKLRELGMTFGGEALLRETVAALVRAV